MKSSKCLLKIVEKTSGNVCKENIDKESQVTKVKDVNRYFNS